MTAAFAPALLVGLFAAALAALLGRVYDPVPPRVGALFLLVVGILLGPVLVGGDTLLPLDGLRGRAPFTDLAPASPHANPLHGDILELVAPDLELVREAYAGGTWPLWNDRAGAGMPLLADPQAQALQPLALAALALPVARAAGALAALRLLVALVFTFLFLRREGLGELAATCGALAWGCGGCLQLWLQWPLANVAALLPVALYAATLLDARERGRDLLLWTLALTALLLAGHPEATLYALVLVALVAVARASRRGSGRRLVFGARAVVGAGLALALAAPALLPARTLLAGSVRAAALRERAGAPGPGQVTAAAMSRLPGHDAEAAVTFSATARRLVPLAAPNAFGNGRYDDPSGVVYWGWSNTNEDASGFVGTATLLLALLAALPQLPGTPRRRRAPREGLFFGVAALCLVGLAAPPAFLRALPAAGQRLVLPLGFALAVLAAAEIDRWRRRGGVPGRELARLGVVTVGLAAFGAWALAAYAHPGHPEALLVLRAGTAALARKALLLASAALVFGTRWRSAGLALPAAIVFELVRVFGPANPPSPARLTRLESPALAYLRERAAREPGWRMAALGDAFPPNQPALFGLRDVRLYGPATPRAYDRFLEPLLATPRGNLPELVREDDPRLDALGVRSVLTARDAAPPARATLVFEDATTRIYERPGALPAFALPAAARRAGAEDAPAPDPLHESRWRGAGPPASAWQAALGAAPPRPQRLDGQHWRLTLRLGERRLLVSTLFDDGNWRVLANGTPLPATTANGPLLGAWLPEGTTRVDVVYRSRDFFAGMVAAAAALAALLATLPGVAADRGRGGIPR